MTAPRIPQKPIIRGIGTVGARLAAVPPKPIAAPPPPPKAPVFIDIKAAQRQNAGAILHAMDPVPPAQKLLQSPAKTKAAFVGAGKANAENIEFMQSIQNKMDRQAAKDAAANQSQDQQGGQSYDQAQQSGGYYDQSGAYVPQQDSGGSYGYPSQGGGGGQSQDSGQQDQGQSYDYTEEYAQGSPDQVSEQLHEAVSGPLRDWESDMDFLELNGFAGEPRFLDDERGTRAAFTEFHNGKVSTVAVCNTPWGMVPIVDSQRVQMGTEEGVAQAMNVSTEKLSKKAYDQNLALAAEDLVIRARQGDQNAMGLIVAIRENAKKGNARAQQSAQLLQNYIAKNPPDDGKLSTFSAEKKSNVLMSACIALADGPTLTAERMQQIASTFGEEKDSKLFLYALVNFKNKELLHAIGTQLGNVAKKIIQMAQTVGTAHTLQLVRTPGVPISVYSAEAGWEHGE